MRSPPSIPAVVLICVTAGLAFGRAATAQSGNCQSARAITATLSAASRNLLCMESNRNWTRGTDLCDPNSFAPYSKCGPMVSSCAVPREDYISDSDVYFSCETSTSRKFFQIIVDPIANFTVPNFVITGEEMTAITVVTAVPRPPTFPNISVMIQIRHGEIINRSEPIPTSTRVTVANLYTYVLFHSFTISREVSSNHTVIVLFDFNGAPHFDSLPIFPGAPKPEVTTQQPTTTEPTTMTEDISTNTDASETRPSPPTSEGVSPSCVGSPVGAVVGIAVGSAVLMSVVSVIATVLIINCSDKCLNKKQVPGRRRKSSYSVDAPNTLQLHPRTTNISDYPTPTPPGYTPTNEKAGLLHSESRRRVNSTPSPRMSVINQQFSRLSSHTSNSPTTPTANGLPPSVHPHDIINFNEASAAAAASSPVIVHITTGAGGMLPERMDSSGSGANAGGDVDTSFRPEADGERHVYSTISEATKQLRNYPPSLRPLPATPPTSNLPSPLVPIREDPTLQSPYEREGDAMALPHQAGDSDTETV